ncbi:cysteine--tRNA ligase [bacterium (Candidatus Blackallbacteria) CG17_big_fil_post_rev_8_21_14_2_50_48_46]|uniref:Cysteine--tRNA ligase n=1 Tax=bacterium (Candidatus Blackallbacteria) CG17_big_fil_post_rev_8_21_14_2_50_48_46 TaxID=2014261 RepID=A0A2M7G860_9BACT|nr:MAG: cysteine--tRNA ligase [bacterium (Candidatus Blackallbacteria) CG18_big_fil_WC_8_21_14_2_50_49_26]PIW18270.1 MAG: cysteine--tRNA ligase [bacterium (Candidatus Blackallbacteria) CG17_big_fil_post_rev_8_21_14_2_50_48_46]PIW49494.1 MAG: cysteine--tRNA ligase [bacterium (Candidatus Blackallbacteria) CG13_big_fil_rev_8_21_14_2_50_49_14]
MTLPKVKLFNTLHREKEIFTPLQAGQVKMYTCGPTVYNYAHIGNLRSYIFPDLLKKLLGFLGYEVTQIMNFTDVGHLTSDADAGDDKIEKAAAAEGKSAWDISRYYAEAFKHDIAALNIAFPTRFTYATDYIPEQIQLVKDLENGGLTYVLEDGVYYDTARFPDYGKMARLDVEGLQEGARIDTEGKRNKTDFALWKFSPKDAQRQMEWESPWGKGFPGWHLECTAMIFAELGATIDIHTGGTDHIPVHHTNEIAQAEGATHQPFVNYWLHGEFLVLDQNQRMGKSVGNFVTLKTLIDAGFSPRAYRYLCLTSHYRHFLTFSQEILKSAQTAYYKLKRLISHLHAQDQRAPERLADFREQILNALCDDLNAPKVIGLLWDLVQDKEMGDAHKLDLIREIDSILSLDLLDFTDFPELNIEIPENIQVLANQRWEARQNKNWAESDRLRDLIQAAGFQMRDGKDHFELVPLDL